MHYPGYLSAAQQRQLIREIVDCLATAPLFTPRMPRSNKPFSVRMSNCGVLGWVSDVRGYRYQATHPRSGEPWPAIPASVRKIWDSVAPHAPPAQACLINYYSANARMGLHQDCDEEDFDAPVVSLSLGDTATFRLGGTARRDRTRSFRLHSGDLLVLGGDTRLAFHGIDRIFANTSTLLAPYATVFAGGGRINLTLRRVTPAGLA